jgi:hypothetical protein
VKKTAIASAPELVRALRDAALVALRAGNVAPELLALLDPNEECLATLALQHLEPQVKLRVQGRMPSPATWSSLEKALTQEMDVPVPLEQRISQLTGCRLRVRTGPNVYKQYKGGDDLWPQFYRDWMDRWHLVESASTWPSPEVKEQHKIQLLGRSLPHTVDRLVVRESGKKHNMCYPPTFDDMVEMVERLDQELAERQTDAAKAREAAVGEKRPQQGGPAGGPSKFQKPFGKPGGKPGGKPTGKPAGRFGKPGGNSFGGQNKNNGGQSGGRKPFGRPGGFKGKNNDGKKPFDGKGKGKDKKE